MLEWEKLALRYDENAIPMYLSYPVESFWRQEVSPESYAKSLKDPDFSFLYFHFPFCKKICHYCMCYKEALKKESDLDAYIQYLAVEMDLKLRLINHSGKLPVAHMHWGGGTPTLLSLQQLETVHNEITKRIDFTREIPHERSLEAYPDETMITREKLQLLKALGFNVISFGIQDFDKRIQKVINREHEPDIVRSLIEMARDAGLRVHVDLCYGLPFQGLNELERTIREILKADPDRICIFPYAHIPLIFPRQKVIPRSSIPNSFVKVLLAGKADELLTGQGFVRLGMDHYLKPDDPFLDDFRVHGAKTLMGYSPKEKVEFMGFGASAISFFDNTFYQNITRLKNYYQMMDQNQLPLEGKKSYKHNDDDFIRNLLIQKYILTRFNIDKKQFSRKFMIDFDDYFSEEIGTLGRYEKDGLVDLSDVNMIRVTEKGRFFSRHIAYVFDKFYKKQNFKVVRK